MSQRTVSQAKKSERAWGVLRNSKRCVSCGLDMEARNSILCAVFFNEEQMLHFSVPDKSIWTCSGQHHSTVKQSFIPWTAYLPNNHIGCPLHLFLGLACCTRKQQSTYTGYIITPPFKHCPSPILSLPGYYTRVPQQRGVLVPFLNPALLCIKEKGKGFAMVHSASCMVF